MLRKFICSAATTAALLPAQAQDSADTKPKLAFSGYVDVYYRYNLGNPAKETGQLNNFTSFTNSQNSFELNMISAKVEHTVGKVSMVADLGFGKRAEEFSYADNKTMLAVKQAYISYSPWNNVKFTAGSWATHVGYEVVDPTGNRNYSMSYLFSYGPFAHTGVKGEATWGRNGFMLGFSNPSDLKSASFSRKFLIAQYSLSMKEDKIKAYVNYQGGTWERAQKMNQLDLVVTAALSKKVSIGFNGSEQTVQEKASSGKFSSGNRWWGSALYLNVDPTPALGLTWRSEYFCNKKFIAATAPGACIDAHTLSANIHAGPLTIIPEFRLEHANKALYTRGHEKETQNTTASALIAAVYKF